MRWKSINDIAAKIEKKINEEWKVRDQEYSQLSLKGGLRTEIPK